MARIDVIQRGENKVGVAPISSAFTSGVRGPWGFSVISVNSVGPAMFSLIDGPNLPVQDAGQRHRWGAPA
ncbi:uncharacterized protein CLUP02_04261 [Colletotrichum lupini]|uniref:Uncharacterized protein n=2 Tax=Colletotrichum acutatum species complex TaxID=2707335 RepID=A0A9Q8SK16_9PEZI|nr:uncharacterized protein CLUP02_04261 [Colletotrichum lupini]KAK1712363.1 hypothetical protein BDP67DRAFT_58042 [Colletotrichum lupini]UQC78784.1 hypothetical protein CLUP02_04261 [Colletotrichum lupini]